MTDGTKTKAFEVLEEAATFKDLDAEAMVEVACQFIEQAGPSEAFTEYLGSEVLQDATVPLKAKKEKLFVVRFYDGFDHYWFDVSKPVPRKVAEEILEEKTEGGKKNASYSDIDYYRIFPANTRMLYDEPSH